MRRRPPRSTRTATLFPYTTLFRSETFAVILDEADRPVDAAWKARRRDLLLATYRRSRPRVVMTELYPFGRRKMRFELDPLLEAARGDDPPALVACSLRDIVNRPDRAEKAAWMVDRFMRLRSEERRGGKECVRTWRIRWSPYH